MAKLIKKAGLLVATAGLTYYTYEKISGILFDKIFKKENIEVKNTKTVNDWFKKVKKKECSIKSFDGLRLDAYLIKNHKTDKYILVSNGWNACRLNSLPYAMAFDKLGYNTLLIDHRASGTSEGEYHTFGQKESLDILNWCEFLSKMEPNCEIALLGISMGAASVMMASELSLPENVKCIIEDCGYSTLKDELENVVKYDTQLEYVEPILKLIELKMKEKLGIRFKDVEPKTSIKSNHLPLLIIHGDADKFVPFMMSKIIYNCNASEKKYYPTKNIKHAESYKTKNYFDVINDFILKNF